MTTLDQLQNRIAKLQKQAEDLMRKKASSVIADIRKLLAEHGLTTADIEAFTGKAKASVNRGPKPGFKRAGKSAAAAPTKKAAAQTKGKLPAKYVNPKTGETWSGWARPPVWIKDVKDRSKFLIASGADAALAASASTVSKVRTAVKKASAVPGAAAHKGQRKGPQPAKYLDPKTGARWSGRGPAPAWLAAAKDRTKFLIDGASAATDTGAVSKPKAAAKKAVTRATVSRKVAATKSTTAKKVVANGLTPVVKTAAKKAPAKKSVAAKKVVTKAVVAAAPEVVGAQATV
jgi:DNA-binding protein H-NS